MTSRKLRTIVSVVCLGFFCFLAAGSMDSNNMSPSSGDSTASLPALQTPRETVLKTVKLSHTCSTDDIILTCNFKIENPAERAFKDFEITCNHFAPSGTKIDSNSRTIYEVVKAHSKRSISNFNMGFIHSQAKSSSCSVTDLTVLE